MASPKVNARSGKPYRKVKSKPYPSGKETLVFGLGAIPKDFAPQIKVRYSRGKRFLGKVTKSEDAAGFARKTYGRGKIQLQEAFVVLFCNFRHEIIGYYLHSTGAINSTVADVRVIFAAALTSLATAMILVHNHPSGNLKPSKADELITEKFVQAGKILEITVLDHLILTKESYFSFADSGLMP
jgi:DNA repair protein RadC